MVAVSQASLDLLEPARNLRGVPTHVIVNAVPASFFEPPAVGARATHAPGFGCRRRRGPGADDGAPGDLQGLPAPDRGAEAVAQPARVVAPDLCLGWHGDLRSSAAGQRLLRRTTTSRCKFLGERLDTRDLLDAADIFVLTSEDEGMFVSVLEAMTRQLPVIATAVGGMADALGATGRLLPAPQPNRRRRSPSLRRPSRSRLAIPI